MNISVVGPEFEAEPIAPEIRAQILEPFVSAMCLTLKEMASTELFLRACYQKKHPTTLGAVSAVICLESAAGGALVVGCDEAAATALAGRILAGAVEKPEPALVRDCLGEIANVVAGQGKALLAGIPYPFSLTTPTIVNEAGQPIPQAAGTTCLVAVFASDVGEMVVEVCLSIVAS